MSPLSYKQPSIHLAWLRDKGLIRTVNEDALLVRSRSRALSEGYETGTYDVDLSSDPFFLGVAHGSGSGDHVEFISKDILRYLANRIFSTKSQRMDIVILLLQLSFPVNCDAILQIMLSSRVSVG